MNAADRYASLEEALRRFCEDRDWDQFHSPKNLSMALAAEAGELLEHFLWRTEDESRNLAPEERQPVAEEMADVLLYLLRLSAKLEIDLLEAAERKLEVNARKYPVDKSKGRSTKYSKL